MKEKFTTIDMFISVICTIIIAIPIVLVVEKVQEKPQEAYLENGECQTTITVGDDLACLNGVDKRQYEWINDLEKRIKAIEDKPEITKYKVIKDIPHQGVKSVIWDDVGNIVEWIEERGKFCGKYSGESQCAKDARKYNCNERYCKSVFNEERNCYTNEEILNKEFFKPIKYE